MVRLPYCDGSLYSGTQTRMAAEGYIACGHYNAAAAIRVLLVDSALAHAERVVVSGGSVSLAAAIEGVPWFADLTHRPLVFVFVVGATISVLLLWPSLSRGSIWWTRVLAGATVLCILGGYFGAVYPTAIELQDHAPITWHEAIAGEATLTAMASALVFGSMLILPGLAFLYRLFKLPVDA